jgi:FkbM family methyltransferase
MFYKLLNVYTRNFSFPHRGLKYFLKAANSLGIANRTYKKRLPENFFMLLNPTEHIQQQLFWYGYYEKEVGALLKEIVRPDDVFLDLGANIGYFSLLIASNSSSVRIISFEPVKDLFQDMNDNISLNNIRNISTINATVGEMNVEKELFVSASDNSGMSSFHQPENYSGKKERVKVVAIDDWFKTSGLSKIDIIKLDIEGSELAALKGMKEVLQKQRPVLIVEVNPETLSMFNLKTSDIYDYLKQLNFKGFLILKNGLLEHLSQPDITETANVLFIHSEKVNDYKKIEILSPVVTTQ